METQKVEKLPVGKNATIKSERLYDCIDTRPRMENRTIQCIGKVAYEGYISGKMKYAHEDFNQQAEQQMLVDDRKKQKVVYKSNGN